MLNRRVHWDIKLQCSKHPRFDGIDPGKVKGACASCLALVEAAHMLHAIYKQVDDEITALMAKAEAAGCTTPGLLKAGSRDAS